MKILIVYDSVSPVKLTAKVAEIIGNTLKEKGFEVDSFFIKDEPGKKMADYGCIIVGGPTMAFKNDKRGLRVS
jgi:flavodoxin